MSRIPNDCEYALIMSERCPMCSSEDVYKCFHNSLIMRCHTCQQKWIEYKSGRVSIIPSIGGNHVTC